MKYHIDACPDCGKYLYPDAIHTCQPKDTAREAFDRLYGHLYLSSADVAWHVFKSGWEACQRSVEQPAPAPCWKCGDMDAAFQAKCTVPACGMKEQPAPAPAPLPPNCGTGYCSCIECLRRDAKKGGKP